MNKQLVGLIGGVLALGLAMPTFGGEGSTKTAVAKTEYTLLDPGTAGTVGTAIGDAVMSSSIHIAQQKDIHVDISLECGLMTQTIVQSKGKKAADEDPDISTASSGVTVTVKVFDDTDAEVANSIYPAGPVTFCRRTQELTAALQGFIGNLDCFEALVNDDDGNVIGGGEFKTECDELYEEEVGLMLDTVNANAFNFVVENLDSGTYRVEAYVDITNSVEVECVVQDNDENTPPRICSSANAIIGHGSMVLDEVRLGN